MNVLQELAADILKHGVFDTKVEYEEGKLEYGEYSNTLTIYEFDKGTVHRTVFVNKKDIITVRFFPHGGMDLIGTYDLHKESLKWFFSDHYIYVGDHTLEHLEDFIRIRLIRRH